MPCKVTFFFNQYQSGWSETYYVTSDDPKTFSDSLTQTFLKNSCAFRSNATFLKAVRTTRLGGARFSVLKRPYPQVQGTRGSTSSGPDVASTDAVIALTASAGAIRRVYMRGFSDDDIFRDAFGNDTISDAISKGVELYVKGMKAYGFAIRYQQRPPNAGLVWQKIEQLEYNDGNKFRTKFRLFPNEPTHNLGDILTFGGIPSGSLPRWPRQLVIQAITLNGDIRTYEVSYALPGGVSVFPDNMRVTKLQYAYDPIADWDFERYSEHKTGRPFGSLRGRARAVGVRR